MAKQKVMSEKAAGRADYELLAALPAKGYDPARLQRTLQPQEPWSVTASEQ